MSSSRRPLVVICCGIVFAAGCGSSSSSRGIGAGASATLSKQVAAVRIAATNHDPNAARQQLAQLRNTVSALQSQGQLPSAKAGDILAAASAVDAQLDALAAPSATSSTVTTTVPAPAAGSNPAGDHGKKRGK